MLSVKIVILIFFNALMNVESWTVDLPQVRQYFFNKPEKKSDDKIYPDPALVEYNNYYGNSLHNTEEYKEEVNRDLSDSKYAKDYEYLGYAEKKVLQVMNKGTEYLEGLELALDRYSELLKNCSRTNFTLIPSNITNSNSSWFPQTAPSIPGFGNFSVTNFTTANLTDARCAKATEKREYVRRYVDLALKTTKELQDKAYASKYQKVDKDEEWELILKLALFLDRIAHVTGYEPEPHKFLPTTTQRPTTTTGSMDLLQAPRNVTNALMNCLKQKSDVPATVRCAYPLPLPQEYVEFFNLTSWTSTPGPDLSVIPSSDTTADSSSLELLVTSASQLSDFPPKMTTDRSRRKRSLNDNPLLEVMKYYAKHKVWTGSNPETGLDKKDYDVNNNLVAKLIQKRSIDYKNKRQPLNPKQDLGYKTNKPNNHLTQADKISVALKNIRAPGLFRTYRNRGRLTAVRSKRSIDKKYAHLRLPEDPFQDLSNIVKHKPGVNYHNDTSELEKIIEYMKKIDSTKLTGKDNLKKIEKALKSIKKRSLTYEEKSKPRTEEDPQQDISYYVKNREGTEYNRDLVQAAQVRAGLEQIYQNGNIEVIRRFGANYNPLIPVPLMAGIIASFSDV